MDKLRNLNQGLELLVKSIFTALFAHKLLFNSDFKKNRQVCYNGKCLHLGHGLINKKQNYIFPKPLQKNMLC